MDEAARNFDEAVAWLRSVEVLDDQARAELSVRLPWVPKSAQDQFFALVKPVTTTAQVRGREWGGYAA
jgi:hypothetical protein